MSKRIITLIVLSILICPQFLQTRSLGSVNNDNNIVKLDSCPGLFPSETETFEMTTFPVDPDLLFCQDNQTMYNQILNGIGNWSTIWPITPWGGHFHTSHLEGAEKWYIYTLRRAEFRACGDGVFSSLTVENGSIITYNDTEIVVDCALTIDLGNNFQILYGHINVLKTIYDEIQSTGTYSFTENEVIGTNNEFLPNKFSLDFHLLYKIHSICPIAYFSEDIQDKIMTYYNQTYERAKISGLYPESKICGNHSCEIENTFWGVWEYDNGPYNDFMFNESGDSLFGAWTFLNRNKTNPETFYRDMKNPNLNLTDDVIGILGDTFPDDDNDYKQLEHNLLKMVEGDFEVGILELRNHWANEWGPANTTVFAKYSIAKNNVGPEDDVLTIEFFADLLSAQTGFTSDNFTLTRYYHFFGYEPYIPGIDWTKIIIIVVASVTILVVILVPVIIIVRRKKKKSSVNAT